MPENNDFTKQIQSYLASLRTAYDQQGQIGKILLPCLSLVVLCSLCAMSVALFRPRGASNVTPLPIPSAFPSDANAATPTPLFNFGPVTFTPFSVPTLPTSTPLPTLTPLPTGTPTLTPLPSTATPLPTQTSIPATVPRGGSVSIVVVNKAEEYVEIQNAGPGPVSLEGWKLVSETGNQACMLHGTLQAAATLRIWARKSTTGFPCGFTMNIWNDNTSDPAVLYNAQGQEVSRVP